MRAEKRARNGPKFVKWSKNDVEVTVPGFRRLRCPFTAVGDADVFEVARQRLEA